jgi:hypothetical protein
MRSCRLTACRADLAKQTQLFRCAAPGSYMYVHNIPVESISTCSSTVFLHKRPRHLEYKFLELDPTSISLLSHASISKFDSNHPRRRRWGWGERAGREEGKGGGRLREGRPTASARCSAGREAGGRWQFASSRRVALLETSVFLGV